MTINNIQDIKILHPRWHSIWICLFLIVVTLAIYWQVSQHEFLNFDDQQYVVSLGKYQKRPIIEDVYRSFSFTGFSHWAPLTLLSHTLDVRLYGMNPKYHLLTSVIFHILNCLLLFYLLKKMTGAIWPSAVVAALFAVHPINAESVAWVSERKNVLSTFFWMLTLLSYYRYAKKPFLTSYLITLIVYMLGLMAKSMLVTLPFVFLLLDYWPLQRLRLDPTEGNSSYFNRLAPPIGHRYHNFQLLIEKIPFLILTAVSIKISLLSFYQQPISFDAISLKLRIANVFVSYLRYLVKIIFPHNLAAYYPFPDRIDTWQIFGALIILAAITGLVIWKMRKYPYLAVGWLWFTGVLVPVSGLVQAGLWPALADRYAYVPQIGIFIICAWGIPELIGRCRNKNTLLGATAITTLLLLMTVAWFQIGYWKNSYTLFERMLKITNQNQIAHLGLGVTLYGDNKKSEAVYHFTEALRINPNFPEAHNSLGGVQLYNGNLNEAMVHFHKALQLKPTYADAYNNLGLALVRQSRLEEAIFNFKRAVRIKKDFTDARRNLSLTLVINSEIKKAIERWRLSLNLGSEGQDIDIKLEKLLTAKKELVQVVRHYERSLAKHPGVNKIDRNQLKDLESVSNEYDELLPEFKRILALEPDRSDVYYHIACISARTGKKSDVIEWLNKALQRGFNDWDLMEADLDLDMIRVSSEYKHLRRRFK